MSPLELVGDFDRLAGELRASRPVASPALRARVAALEPPSPRFSFGLPSRRVVLALAAVGLLGSFVAAAVTGLGGGSQKITPSAGRALKSSTPRPEGTTTTWENSLTDRSRGAFEGRVLRASTQALPHSVVPTTGRLQRYDARLRLRVENVDGLSRATQRAINLTRGLGGYVGSVDYATRGGKRGGATLVLRVPVANIQPALDGLSDLGTILQQRTGILDVTRRADREATQIEKLERELAEASPSEAPAIRARLRTLRAKHARLLRSAQLARIVLGLTTPAKQVAAPPTRFDRTLDDAGAVLLRELEILLYAAVVAGPLLLLGGAGIASARAARRRSDRRLLERA